MAITTTVSIRSAANADIPEAYVPTTLPTLVDPQKVQEATTIACTLVDGVTEAATLGNIVTQLTTYLTGTYYPNVLKLDSTKTIAVNVDVFSLVRERSTNDLITGTERFAVTFLASWA